MRREPDAFDVPATLDPTGVGPAVFVPRPRHLLFVGQTAEGDPQAGVLAVVNDALKANLRHGSPSHEWVADNALPFRLARFLQERQPVWTSATNLVSRKSWRQVL